MRIGATILSLMLAIGLSVAAQTAATNAPANACAFSSLLRPSEGILSPQSSPQTDPPGDTLHVDLEAYNNAVGLTSGGTFYTAARLTATTSCTVSSVIFYRWNTISDDYMFVWAAGTTTQPGAVIESIPFFSAESAWNRVDLLTPVNLNAGDDIWVGPRMTHTAGTYPLGTDDGPYVATRGDFINYQGTWEELGPLGLSYNWHIRAVLGGGTPTTNDVGATSILSPAPMVPPNTYIPTALIRNFGTASQTGFDVECWIDSLGNNVYDNTVTYTGTLAAGATDTVELAAWTSGPSGNVYSARIFTSLAGDENPANDTARATITVQSAIWETIPKPPADVDRIVHATVYDPDNDKIYMIGGNPAGQLATYLTDCQEYDPAAGTWTTKAPMTTPRGWLPGSYCDGKIYMIGGHDNSNVAIAVNECFDPVANSWSAKAARPRVGLSAAEVTWNDSLIYVLGGSDGSAGLTNVDIYDPANNAWTVGTALPQAMFMGSAAIIGDTIFMVQGYTGSACWPNLYKGVIDPTTPTTITWTAGPAPTEPIFNGATVAMDGNIYWLGGFINASTVTNHVWKYSTATGTISAVTPNYPVTLGRLNFMCARPSTHELFVLAGDMLGDWNAPNQKYYHISFAPAGIEEQRIALGGTIDNVSPTLARNNVRINFTVAHQGNVNLNVYDATGKLVRTLVNGTVQAGSRSATWNRTDNSGRRVVNGSYFYRLTVNGKTVSGKSIIVN